MFIDQWTSYIIFLLPPHPVLHEAVVVIISTIFHSQQAVFYHTSSFAHQDIIMQIFMRDIIHFYFRKFANSEAQTK